MKSLRAFSRARAKLNPSAFVEMNENVLQTFYDEAPYLCWHGMRLLACDGTRLVLPRHESIVAEYGEHGFSPNADSKKSLALGSFLYDTLNLVTLDAQLAPYHSSEQELLRKHLEKVGKGDLLLLDRGYPSLALMFELHCREIEFCIRMKDNWWLDVKAFDQSGKKDQFVTFELPAKDSHVREAYLNCPNKLKCRLIAVDLPNGEREILCTSLVKKSKYTYADICEPYPHRWGVEEAFKLFKTRVEVENFSRKTAREVQQDYHAKVFMMTLCAVLAFPIEQRVREEHLQHQLKHPKKINRTGALAMMGNVAIGLFLTSKVNQVFEPFDKIVAQTTEIIRPGRKTPRHKKLKSQMIYKQVYKRI